MRRSALLTSLLLACLAFGLACPSDDEEACSPIMQGDTEQPAGFVRCGSEALVRVESVTCEVPEAVGNCAGTTPDASCVRDTDCTARPYGRCNSLESGNGSVGCFCSYGCQTDADCDQGSVCVCAGGAEGMPPTSTCVPASCRTSADCETGECRLGFLRHTCNPSHRIACTTAEDECHTQPDCNGQDSCYPNDERWICVIDDCA